MSKDHLHPSKKQKVQSKPTNSFVCPMLTDMYQISMTYAYWKGGKADEDAVFDLFFRKAPFSGEFAIFAGLDEVLPLLESFKFTEEDVRYLKDILPRADPEFFDWLKTLGCAYFVFEISLLLLLLLLFHFLFISIPSPFETTFSLR